MNIEVPFTEREFFDDVFERVTQAPLIHGNSVELLRDARENYPEWLAAIDEAENRIYFESYIIHEDEQGKIFADALIKKAKAGVEVKLIYDWLGGFGKTSRKYWRHLSQNGVDVRVYNPPNLTDPLGFVTRDHRKILVADGKTAFVTGLCVGQDWVGRPEKNIPGWRDTGVKITGPAVSDVEDSFADVWKTTGAPLKTRNKKSDDGDDFSETGSVALRVVQSVPGSANIYRMDLLLAAAASESMWFTDAYFIGLPSYLQALKDAAGDGVDVRILVPQSTDIALITDTTRSTYRPLLEAGVRVFEWNGPMMHAKTAVFDGQFARVGSTNLNIASWLGNYELDVLVQDAGFGKKMQEMFLSDLENSTEIVLGNHSAKRKDRRRTRQKSGGGSMRKATAGALNAATSIGSAITKKMPLGAGDARLLLIVGFTLLGIAVTFVFFPRFASIPLVALLLLLAIPTLAKAFQAYRNN
jgi:cardiolipin synthase